jgi:integrase
MLAPLQRRPKRAPHKIRLRELSVKKARRKAEPYLVWDSVQRGLALRVYPSGTKSWVVVYSRAGRPRWLGLGNAADLGLADARLMAAEAMLAAAKGKDPAAEKRAERSKGTFEELAVQYVEQHAKSHNKSWRQAEALIRSNALPRLGKLAVSNITRDDVKTMKSAIKAPIVANQTLAAVSAIFTWATKEGIVTVNPAKLIDRHPVTSRERVLSESEIPAFWAALDDIDPVRASALRMILLLGQRPGEIACMRHEHIHDNWWEMPGKPVPELRWPGTKNAESHRIWLPAPAQELIAGDDRKAGFVFAGPHGGRPVRDLDQAMRTISTRLGIEPIRPHDLRRTHGTTITKLKFGRSAMNRIQNHKEGGIADVYDVHDYAEENRNIMEAVAAKIMSLIEPTPANVSRPVFGRRNK